MLPICWTRIRRSALVVLALIGVARDLDAQTTAIVGATVIDGNGGPALTGHLADQTGVLPTLT